VLEPRQIGEGQLSLAEIVAARIGVAIEHSRLQAELSDAALAGERNRLARDLHDGVLQDLTAANLLVKAIANAASPSIRESLHEVSTILSQQQRRIREFVSVVNPKPEPRDWDFGVEFRSLVAALESQWQCSVTVDIRPPELRVPGALGSQIFLIFAEAMANAVQHGHSDRVAVTMEGGGETVRILIRDYGRGFPAGATGESSAKVEPFSLRQRIADLRGTLDIASSTAGVELRIELPLP
jgi:signal transduction histidine kinase